MTTARDNLKDEVLSRLQGEGLVSYLKSLGFDPVRKGREYAILCPYHDDHRPSLTISLPGVKSPGGILYCHSCKSGGDAFKFTQETQGLGNFRETLDFMAYRLGLTKDGPEGRAPPPTKERVQITPSSQPLSAPEVYAALKRIREHKEDPAPVAAEFRLSPVALDLFGGFVARVRKDVESGKVAGGRGCLALVAPMRFPGGEMSSLRFRSLEKREPGEKSRRWSLDENKPGTDEQARYSMSGLLAPQAYFEAPPRPGQLSMVVEGETDLWAGIDMMLPYGEDPLEWPARWYGLPGVMSCHEMLVKELVGDWVCTFFDSDRAGRMAVFDHKPMVCELCGKRVTHGEFCRAKVAGKGECGGRTLIDIAAPLVPGLLSEARERGITKAMAAFPRPENGKKTDLRDLRTRENWDWPRLYDHILGTGTRRTRT